MRRIRPASLLRGLIAAILLVWGGCLAVSSGAYAHAALVSAEPGDGALLPGAPGELALGFSEPVALLRLTLVRPDGSSLDLRTAASSGPRVTAALPGTLGRGTHILVWRVVSADGHPVTGNLSFSLGNASPTPDLPPASDPLVQALVWGSRVLLYFALVFGVGGAAGAYLVGAVRSRLHRPIRLVLLAGLMALPLAILAQGLDALGAPFGALAQGAVWRAGVDTGFGPAAMAFAFSFALAGVATLLPSRRANSLFAGLALLASGVALASTGHAANAEPQVLTRPAVALHALSAALWLGALLPLAAALRQPGPERVAALTRFSRRIAPLLAVLLVTGAFLAVVQVGKLPLLWQTDYGRVLLGKLAQVLVLFLIAADNRWRLTQPALRGDAPALRSLSRRLGAEIVPGMLILSAVAVWRFTPPPRVELALAAEPIQLHATGDTIMADLSISPGRPGPVRVSALMMTIDYAPVDPAGVVFVFSRPQGDAAPIEVDASRPGDGRWSASTTLPKPGLWHLRIELPDRTGLSTGVETEFHLKP